MRRVVDLSTPIEMVESFRTHCPVPPGRETTMTQTRLFYLFQKIALPLHPEERFKGTYVPENFWYF